MIYSFYGYRKLQFANLLHVFKLFIINLGIMGSSFLKKNIHFILILYRFRRYLFKKLNFKRKTFRNFILTQKVIILYFSILETLKISTITIPEKT